MRERAGHVWWWAFVTVGVIHLVGQLAALGQVADATKPALMPLLVGWFVSVTSRGRLRTLLVVGLGLSWCGDLALMRSGEAWFLTGLGAFLLAQLAYAVAFWPSRARSVLSRPALVVPYAAVLVGLLAILWTDLGDLRVPVMAYAIVIIAMAVLATGLGPTVAVGALLFVLSDALIALDTVADLHRLPAHGFWVMLTYLGAQALIARGVQQHLHRPATATATPDV